MNLNWSETSTRQGAVWRWAGAMFAAVAMSFGAAPAVADGDANMTMTLIQDPTPANRPPGANAFAVFNLVLTNNGPSTVNNVLIYVNTTEGAGSPFLPDPCGVPRGAVCTVNASAFKLDLAISPAAGQDANPQPGFVFSTAQLKKGQTATATVKFNTPASGPLTIKALAVGTSGASSNTPSAQTIVKPANYPAAAQLREVPVAPNVGIAIAQEPGPFARSVTPCDLTVPAVDGCGYAVYRVTVTNKSGVLVPGPFYVDFTGTGTVTDTPVQLSDIPACAGSCAQTGTPARVEITNLSATVPTEILVQFTTPIGVAATSTVKAQIVFPDFPPPAPSDSTSPTLVAFDDLPPDTLLPISTNYGGTVRKSKIDPGTGGNFKSAFKIPSDNANKYKGLKTSVDESVGMESCSPSFKICLDTALKIVTGAGVVYHQDGTLDDTVNSSILTITLIRDFKTFASSGNALHSQIYYRPDGLGGVKVNVPDCGSVDITSPTTLRCVQRTFDTLKKDKKNVYISGEVTFIIIARENGLYSW